MTERPPTLKMLEWLHLLEMKPGSSRAKNRIGYACMTRGWTEWNYVNPEGEAMTHREAEQRYGHRYWDHVRIAGERITEKGREILRQHSP